MSMWLEFERVIWADQAISRGQRLEGRRVFFQGAGAMLACCKRIGDEAQSEDDGAKMFERLQAEIDAFWSDEIIRKRRGPTQ